MKPFFKYITLLLVGGVIIPFCYGTLKTKPVEIVIKPVPVHSRDGFSVIKDVVAKLLPAVKYF